MTDENKTCRVCGHLLRFHGHPEKGCDAVVGGELPEHYTLSEYATKVGYLHERTIRQRYVASEYQVGADCGHGTVHGDVGTLLELGQGLLDVITVFMEGAHRCYACGRMKAVGHKPECAYVKAVKWYREVVG